MKKYIRKNLALFISSSLLLLFMTAVIFTWIDFYRQSKLVLQVRSDAIDQFQAVANNGPIWMDKVVVKQISDNGLWEMKVSPFSIYKKDTMRDLVGGLLSWEANYLATNNKVGRVFVFHEGKTNKPPIDDFSWHDDKDVQRSLYQLKK